MSARQFSHISVVNNVSQHYQNRPDVVKNTLYSEQVKTALGCDPGLHEEWNSFVVKHGTFIKPTYEDEKQKQREVEG